MDNTIKHETGLPVTLLILPILAVFMGAAMSPALGQIKVFYKNYSPTLIQMILSLPCLSIMLTNLSFNKISKKLNSKTIAIIGLVIYVISGVLGGVVSNIYLLLLTRFFIGIGVGLIMPLSTGLLGYYYSKERQNKLQSYSIAISSIGGIFAMILSGYLASISWRYSFLSFLIGIIIIILAILFLPKTKLNRKENTINKKDIKTNINYFIMMFLFQLIFFLYATNFALISQANKIITPNKIGLLMSIEILGTFLSSLIYSNLKNRFGESIKYFGFLAFAFSYLLFFTQNDLIWNIIALFLNGIGFGTLNPYLNISIIKNNSKEKAVSNMAIMSFSMFLGRFLSPIILSLTRSIFKVENNKFNYLLGFILSFVILFLLIFNKKEKI